jgi:hypothetical protein
MPARNGTGPVGQGSRTGRGLGNCIPSNRNSNQTLTPGRYGRSGLGGRLWDFTIGRLMGRKQTPRLNKK